MVGHELRTGGAVEADGEQIGVRDGGVERVDRSGRRASCPALDGAGDHDGDALAQFAFELLDREQRRL